MTTLNKPENFKPIEAHDLGQISIKALLDFIEKEADHIEAKQGSCYWIEELALDYQAKTLDSIVRFIIEHQQAKTKPEEIREGMTEFVGPPRRVWVWTEQNNGQDPRTMTGGETYRHSEFRRDFHFTIDDLDAPRRIAAGSNRESIMAEDPDRNVFPTTIDRDFF